MSELLPDNIKAVIFDFDDTLVGSYRPSWNLHRYIAENYYNTTIDDTTLLEYWGQPIEVLARQYYGTTDVDTAMKQIREQVAHFPKEIFSETVPTLRRLKSEGKLVGIVSASHRPIVMADMRATGIPADIVDYIQTADDTPVHKPDPAVFGPMLAWARANSIHRDGIVYIGDSTNDMIAAKGAGLHFIGVPTGQITQKEFRTQGALCITSLSELR